jgi:Na+-transporting methylmalonyl-CoA/oxaloacetate decarboxylase gamma subunit
MFVLPILVVAAAFVSDVTAEPAGPPRRACRTMLFDGTVCRPVAQDRVQCVTVSAVAVSCPGG